MTATFNEDWDAKEAVDAQTAGDVSDKAAAVHAMKVAKKVAKAVARDLGPVTPVVETTVNELVTDGTSVGLNSPEIETTVKNAVKDAVREVVRGFVEEAVERRARGGETMKSQQFFFCDTCPCRADWPPPRQPRFRRHSGF